MRRRYRVLGALLVAALLIPACKQIEETTEKYNPMTIEPVGQTGINKVTLTASAVERIGIATAPVAQITRNGAARITIPYGAVIYDHSAKTWTYTNPEPLVFVRHAITIETIDGDTVTLSSGPPVGTKVVTVGATLLFGAENGLGK